jgi:hypothetical protein
VPARAEKSKLFIDQQFGPGGGVLFMVTERPIAGVRVEVPPQARCGQQVTCDIAIVDGAGRPLDAIVPVEVKVLDAEGKPAEFSGFYGAKDGRLSLKLELAANDVPGPWRVRVQELASGLSQESTFAVAR